MFTNLLSITEKAILAAVTEVIKDQGGEETSTEYFAALLTTLEATDTGEGLSAVVSLLSMVIKTVPQEVIRSRFSKVSYIQSSIIIIISVRFKKKLSVWYFRQD